MPADHAATPIDPDTGPPASGPREPLWPVLAAVAAGGAIGASARFTLSEAFPHPAGVFAWSTFAVNVSGCLLIGALMTAVAAAPPRLRLLRPLFGTGILGGYTTFSAHIADARQSLAAGAPAVALLSLAGTLAAGLVAVWCGAVLAERAAAGWRAVRRRNGGRR